MQLYDYFRSSAAYRVRIALNIKQVDYSQIPINLLEDEQHSSRYLAINSQGLLPTLETEEGSLTQSLAIMEWLEDQYPTPMLIPGTPEKQARIRQLAYTIACDIHPLNNLRVLKYLTNKLALSEQQKIEWIHHWISEGFNALETLVGVEFCISDSPTLADICLVPQMFNAMRFEVQMENYPKLVNIYNNCNQLEAFKKAKPENQADAI